MARGNPYGNPNWAPGVSGNPNGRPRRGDTFSDLLEKELKKRKYTVKESDGTSKKVNGKQAIIRAHLSIVFGKESSEEVRLKAIDSLYDRVDGKPRQALEHSGPNGGPIEVMTYEDALKRLEQLRAEQNAG